MQKLIKFIITLFCSINPYYYFRQFIFGAAISCFFVLVIGKSSFEIIIPAIIYPFLYPYSRFAYETIIDFIRGNNVITGDKIIENDKVIIVVNKIIVNDYNTKMLGDIIWLFFKVIGMVLCFLLSPFMIPIGLVLLYFLQRKSTEIE